MPNKASLIWKHVTVNSAEITIKTKSFKNFNMGNFHFIHKVILCKIVTICFVMLFVICTQIQRVGFRSIPNNHYTNLCTNHTKYPKVTHQHPIF